MTKEKTRSNERKKFRDVNGNPIKQGFYDDSRDPTHQNMIYLERFCPETGHWEGVGNDTAILDMIGVKELRYYRGIMSKEAFYSAIDSPASFRQLGKIIIRKITRRNVR
ncbi:MAG: hypothetical protein KKD18_05315 [Nanoarchaeota archaeon]|nr:hypothetical protein [Nanoarchaeota archaeon]MBU0977809.1 hypothetical protein [Nanoarchaeota archaeon]